MRDLLPKRRGGLSYHYISLGPDPRLDLFVLRDSRFEIHSSDKVVLCDEVQPGGKFTGDCAAKIIAELTKLAEQRKRQRLSRRK